MNTTHDNVTGDAGQRLDTWLWAARFFSSRKLSSDSIRAGHVTVNGHRAKPARQVHVGDTVRVRKNHLEYTLSVLGLSAKRLGASLAVRLYEETGESREKREARQALLHSRHSGVSHDRRRPGKRDRRAMMQVKHQALAGDDE